MFSTHLGLYVNKNVDKVINKHLTRVLGFRIGDQN